jgi:hypothetical protein
MPAVSPLLISIVTFQDKEFLSICRERMLTVQSRSSTVRIFAVDQYELPSMILGPVPITIVVMNVAMIGEMIVTETTVTKKKDTAVNAQGLLVALNMMNVVHLGLRPLGGRLTIKGLQGTMITGAEAMMTAERLIIILTVAGTIRTDAETIEDVTTKKSASMKDQDTQMEKDGRVEEVLIFNLRKKRTADGGILVYFVVLSFTRTVYF